MAIKYCWGFIGGYSQSQGLVLFCRREFEKARLPTYGPFVATRP